MELYRQTCEELSAVRNMQGNPEVLVLRDLRDGGATIHVSGVKYLDEYKITREDLAALGCNVIEGLDLYR